ncbi:MAG TPA: aldehyde dehydrogenase family protein [Steroidobacteraceae bacterium]|nr:aldehyde dehydrogenase family protein [Steroidobacteraceae bacterium]
MDLPTLDHLIDGRFVRPASGEYVTVANPATGQPIGRVAAGDARDVDVAVSAARRAFEQPGWRDLAPGERSNLVHRLVGVIARHAEELVLLESISTGGTVSRIATIDLLGVIEIGSAVAEAIQSYPFVEELPLKKVPEPTQAQVLREPVGVCALITAWNFPLMQFVGKALTALAAGNTVIVKPSELAPNSTVRLAELWSAELPPGVLNVVNGTGAGVGDAISSHPGIDKISFTGSTAIGRRIQRLASETLKRVTLELGGKGPAIVRADADIELTAHGVLFGFLLHSGQACESGTRLVVHEDVREPLLARMVEIAAGLRIGNPLAPDTAIGPLCHVAHGEKVLGYVRSAVDDGARVLCGGERVTVAGCEGGFFVAPTILDGCRSDMRAVREEIFGPVLTVLACRSDDEAVAIANDTSYGLSAGVWSADPLEAQRLGRRLRAGSVWINDWHVLRPDLPFGGYKTSGIGREFARAGLEAFLETKSMTTAFERSPQARQLVHGVLHRQRGH